MQIEERMREMGLNFECGVFDIAGTDTKIFAVDVPNSYIHISRFIFVEKDGTYRCSSFYSGVSYTKTIYRQLVENPHITRNIYDSVHLFSSRYVGDIDNTIEWLTGSFICSHCGEIGTHKCSVADGKGVCRECFDAYYVYDQSICNWVVKNDELYSVECLGGFKKYWSREEDYNRRVVEYAFDPNKKLYIHDAIEVNNFGYILPEDAKKSMFRKCYCCGKLHLKTDLTKNFCNTCMTTKQSNVLGYHHNPTRFYFLKDKVVKQPRKFSGYGIELEVQSTKVDNCRMNDDKTRQMILDCLDSPYPTKELYFMSDGSIGNGFEMITQPHAKEDLLKMNWEKILDTLVKRKYRSHNGGACGLHIHSSRNLYGDTVDEQNDNIAKIIYFYEKNYNDMFIFSRREGNRWCRPYIAENSDRQLTPEYCKNIARKCYDRYHTVNVTNRSTVEYRIFRGTLVLSTFLSALDLTFTLIENSKNISWDDVDDVSKWLSGINDTTKQYMKRRKCFEGVIA